MATRDRTALAGEISIHFTAEEQVLFPEARKFGELDALVEELLADHAALRIDFSAMSGKMSGTNLADFARRLSGHIRKEERLLFERLQKLLDEQSLAVLGQRLEDVLKDAAQVCALPAKPKA